MSKRASSPGASTPVPAMAAPEGIGATNRSRARSAVLVGCLLAVALLVAACAPARVVESWRVLADIQAGWAPSALKAATPQPSRTAITFAGNGRARAADLYRPGAEETAAAGIVLVPGLTPRGRDDPRIVAFANTLARARFRVLVPDLEGLRALQVSACDAQPIADALAHLAAGDGAGQPLGLAAVSFAVGPAVLALLTPRAGAATDFVITIGGYYDLADLIRYVTTGFYTEPGEDARRFRPPKRYGRWVFLLSNAARIEDTADREALRAIALRRLDDADAAVGDLEGTLGPEGRAVYALITNTDPERTTALLAALPPAIRAEMDALDLAGRDLSGLGARFVLIHDANDRIIPAGHTLRLAAALPAGAASVFLIDSLDHAEPRPPGLWDALRLLRAVYTVLALRDAAPVHPDAAAAPPSPSPSPSGS